jgi:hypothetical protein
MIDQNGTTMPHTRCTCVGPLTSHINGFVGFLRDEGYSPKTVKTKHKFIIDLKLVVGALQAAFSEAR